ncbi:phosphatidylserine/phosphatidylglycerophosphate/cardiolipin synthase family protein [Sediminibacterium sp. C3]|uniref:phospholipase D-like domain-containing protein n=1 Tax=Sediminibacterium sp. C3 TaxID=1267211 RepID=UPI00040DE129|nr:phospholipase D-like domain-containing protein [Sediminibacterium sp. C3]
MSKFISNNGKFSGGYFVLNKAVEEKSFESGQGFYVTCKTDKGLLNSIVNLISEAESYIKICSFIIDNKQIVETLITKLKEAKLSVFILTAVDDKNIKSDMLDKYETAELSKSRHFEFIDALVKAGAHVRASSNAHAKFVIKDGEEALLMSANLTEPSLSNNEKGKAPNDESGIIIDKHDEVKILERIFDSIFLYGTEFRRFINLSDNTQLIGKNENDICKSDFPESNTNVIWSYDRFHHSIYENLNSFIANARETVNLSTYSIVELDNLSELINAFKIFLNEKKGKIKIYCRAMNHRYDHIAACKELSELGIEIYGDMFNHSKGISVDNREGIIFTANIDGKHGLKDGFEVGYKIDSSHISFEKFNSFLNYQIQSAPFVYKLSPNKTDLFDFYKFWYDEKEIKVASIFPEIFEIKFRSNASFANEFEELISNNPIFFTPLSRLDTKEIQLKIMGKAYLLDKLNEFTFVVKKKLHFKDIVKGEEYMLFYNKINLTKYES